MTTLLKKDYQYSSVLWEEVMQRVQEIIRDEYNISPYVSPTLNPKTPSPFRIWSSAQGTDALYVGAWHKEYTISVNHYLKTEDSERFYRKVYEESERLYQLFFNNQGTQSTQTLGFFGGRPEGIQISQEGDYFRIEVLFTCEVLRADDVVYVQVLPSEIRATKRALELPFNFWSLDFDGTDDYLHCGSSIFDVTSNAISISIWFNLVSTGTRTLISRGSGTSGAGYMINYEPSYPRLVVYSKKSTSYQTLIYSGSISYNKWNNLVWVNGGTNNPSYLYLNGESIATTTWTSNLTSQSSENLLIGSNKSFSTEFVGQISETAIFNSVLSSSEISTIYNDGQPILLTENQGGYKSSGNLVSYYRMGSGSGDNRITTGYIADQVDSSIGSEMVDNGGFDGISNGTNVTSLDDWTAYGTAISTTIEDGKLRIVSDALGEGAKLLITGATNDAFYRFTCDVTGDLGLHSVYALTVEGNANISTTNGSVDIVLVGYASKITIIFRAGTGTSGGTSYYDNISVKPLNGNAGSMANFDSLDFRTNVPLLYDKALFSNSLVFDGTDDYVDISSIGDYGTGAFSWSVWFKCGNDDTIKYLLGNISALNTLYITSTEAIRFRIANGQVTTEAGALSSPLTWNHIVATRDGSNVVKIYLNGVEQALLQSDGSTYSTDDLTLSGTQEIKYIGKESSDYVDATFSDVALFSTGLDATNVTAIYNSGKPIDLTCDAGNYNNANNLVGYWKMGDGYLDELPSADINGAIVDQVTPIIGDDVLSHNIDDWTLGNNSGATSTKAYSDGVYTITRESEGTGTAYTYIIQSGIENNTLYKVNFSYKTTVNLEVLGTYDTGSAIALSPTTEYIEKTVFILTNSTYAGKFQIRAVGNFQLKNLTYKKVNGNSGLCVNMNASAQSISVPK